MARREAVQEKEFQPDEVDDMWPRAVSEREGEEHTGSGLRVSGPRPIPGLG
jgi:hypothetical protein